MERKEHPKHDKGIYQKSVVNVILNGETIGTLPSKS